MDSLLAALIISGLIEGVAKLAELHAKLSRGEEITLADLDASKKTTDLTMDRLRAALKRRLAVGETPDA